MNEKTEGVAAQGGDPNVPHAAARADEAAAQVTEIIYMPGPSDPDETVVDTVVFKAYEPTKLPDGRAYLGGKLHANPFFTSAHDVKPDHDERRKAWSRHRDLQHEAAETQKSLDAANEALTKG